MRALFLCLPLLVMSGCFWDGENRADLETFIKTTQDKPRGRIEPIPEFKPYEFFSYSAAALRSPFEEEKAESKTTDQDLLGNSIKPNLERRREPLESYSLNTLTMMGTMKLADGALYALVKNGEGNVVRVRKDNYMGPNHGRIVDINEQRINLIEIVPNGTGGWLERPRTLALDGLVGE